ncbi:hypothetical protein [Pseudomonas synxantha]|nr:hypothetical protein [Pseudomonas synxantha]AZE80204.1 hypothetical protein C4J99_4446 [Pseudomonas synxantha]
MTRFILLFYFSALRTQKKHKTHKKTALAGGLRLEILNKSDGTTTHIAIH